MNKRKKKKKKNEAISRWQFSSSGVFGHSLPAGNYTTLLGPLHF